MVTWRKKFALVLNFIAIVLVSTAVLRSHDRQIHDKVGGAQDVQKEVDDMLHDLHTGRRMTLIALVLAAVAFLLEGYDHIMVRH